MATIINLRFAGQYYDGETGLHYNYFRYYDPGTGRYITADPIGILWDYSSPELKLTYEMGLINIYGVDEGPINHLYNYVDNNPLIYFDFEGLAKGKNKGKPVNPNRNPNKKKGGGSGTGTRKGDAGRERNRGIDEEHSRRPKGGFRIPGVPFLICPVCSILFEPPEELPAC
jgi:hypothetical protein